MKKFSLWYLLISIIATIAVMWVPARWATALPELAGFILAAAWVAAVIAGLQKPRLIPVLFPLCGLLLWGAVQILFGTTVYRWQTRMAILYWAGNLSFFFCGLQVFSDRKVCARFLRALVAAGFVISIFSTAQAFTSQGKIYWYFATRYIPTPVFGTFLYRNQYAAFAELILPVALHMAITARKQRAWYFLIVATLFTSVLASSSRAGFILVTLELVAVPLIVAGRRALSRKYLLNGALVLIGMLLWLAIPAGPDALIAKLGNADPFSGRREFNQSSLLMIRAKPLMGFGLGNWPTAFPGYATFDDGLFANQAHNDWAQWTVEGGVPFLCLMLWIAVWGARRGIRTGWGIGVPIIFLHCFVDYPIQRPGVSIVFFLLLAAVAGTGPSGTEVLTDLQS